MSSLVTSSAIVASLRNFFAAATTALPTSLSSFALTISLSSPAAFLNSLTCASSARIAIAGWVAPKT